MHIFHLPVILPVCGIVDQPNSSHPNEWYGAALPDMAHIEEWRCFWKSSKPPHSACLSRTDGKHTDVIIQSRFRSGLVQRLVSLISE